jgi:hypothetical protein
VWGTIFKEGQPNFPNNRKINQLLLLDLSGRRVLPPALFSGFDLIP